MIDPEQLHAHADRIRASQILGRSELMHRLFDFFVECSGKDKVPKEIEIAVDVFGKNARFEVTQDAMVRVYIHKLRRKLEHYYAGPGQGEQIRLVIPRGEYRLTYEVGHSASESIKNPSAIIIQELASTETLSALPAATSSVELNETLASPRERPLTKSRWNAEGSRWRHIALVGVAILIGTHFAVWWLAKRTPSPTTATLAEVRANPLWYEMVADNQPIYIVVGDYYIFGELNSPAKASTAWEANAGSVQRLVREFSVNSRNDLEQLLKQRPELAERYMDVALRYLPVSAAFALHNIIPILEPNKKNPRQVQMILASDLTPSMIRSSHIVYIGLLSGMGLLCDIAFAGSQFKIGDTYDELLNRKSGKTYASEANIAFNDNTRYRDYGYFSTFAGPNSNRIVILAGTRDVALMHIAEAVSHPEPLAQLIKQASAWENFEALYVVDAIDRMNLDGKLLLTDRINVEKTWSGEATTTMSVLSSDVKSRLLN